MAPISIPEVTLTSGNRKLPALGLGTVAFPVPEPEIVIKSIIDAIELGYRHFDTASAYRTEEPLGEAISQALGLGLIQSRNQVFITTKLWVNDAHADCVLPALQKSLQNLKMEYVDQYLIHWPVSMKRGPIRRTSSEDMLPLDIKSVWTSMEECQTLGLAKSIGVCNFTVNKLTHLLSFAKIPPAVNQFEMNAAWQQRKLNELCKAKGIVVAAYMPLGAAGNTWGTNRIMESEVLKEIASAKGKSVAQVALKWLYQQGAVVIVKSFNKERMKQNMEIFDWELSDEDNEKIGEIPQVRTNVGTMFLSPTGPFKSIEELWDGEL